MKNAVFYFLDLTCWLTRDWNTCWVMRNKVSQRLIRWTLS